MWTKANQEQAEGRMNRGKQSSFDWADYLCGILALGSLMMMIMLGFGLL